MWVPQDVCGGSQESVLHFCCGFQGSHWGHQESIYLLNLITRTPTRFYAVHNYIWHVLSLWWVDFTFKEQNYWKSIQSADLVFWSLTIYGQHVSFFLGQRIDFPNLFLVIGLLKKECGCDIACSQNTPLGIILLGYNTNQFSLCTGFLRVLLFSV